MERLTARSPRNNMFYLVNVKDDEQEVESKSYNTLKCIQESWEKLAQYEETGLSPAGVAELIAIKTDLLEALKALLEICKFRSDGAVYKASKAIAKATETTPSPARIVSETFLVGECENDCKE